MGTSVLKKLAVSAVSVSLLTASAVSARTAVLIDDFSSGKDYDRAEADKYWDASAAAPTSDDFWRHDGNPDNMLFDAASDSWPIWVTYADNGAVVTNLYTGGIFCNSDAPCPVMENGDGVSHSKSGKLAFDNLSGAEGWSGVGLVTQMRGRDGDGWKASVFDLDSLAGFSFYAKAATDNDGSLSITFNLRLEENDVNPSLPLYAVTREISAEWRKYTVLWDEFELLGSGSLPVKEKSKIVEISWNVDDNLNPGVTSGTLWVDEIYALLGDSHSSVLPSVRAVSSAAARVTVHNRTLMIRPSSPETVSRVRLIDMRGRSVASFNVGAAAPGRPQSFSLAKIPAGRYFVEVREGARRERVSVVIR